MAGIRKPLSASPGHAERTGPASGHFSGKCPWSASHLCRAKGWQQGLSPPVSHGASSPNHALALPVGCTQGRQITREAWTSLKRTAGNRRSWMQRYPVILCMRFLTTGKARGEGSSEVLGEGPRRGSRELPFFFASLEMDQDFVHAGLRLTADYVSSPGDFPGDGDAV